MHHRKRGADAPPLRLHRAPASEAGDRLARPSPEEGRRVALLPIGDGDPGLLGSPRRLRGAAADLPQPRSRPVDRTRRGGLLETEPDTRGTPPVPNLGSGPLPRP